LEITKKSHLLKSNTFAFERSWRGEWVNPATGVKEKYTPNAAFSVPPKLKLLSWGYDMAVKNAAAQKSLIWPNSVLMLSKATLLTRPLMKS